MMRIQSWNVAQSLEKPAAFIKNWSADIYCLLECDSEHELDKLCDGKHYRYLNDNYNMALVSAFPITAHKEIRHPDISKPILSCEIDVHGQIISLYVVHLIMPLNSNEKHAAQLKEIEFLQEILKHKKESTVIIGDLNARSARDDETDYTDATQMLEALGFIDSASLSPDQTFIATKIDRSNCGKRIDYCFLTSDLAHCFSAYGVQDSDADISDHRAIWVDLDIN